ncbi:MAG: hypothetical protein V3T23_11785 [Nitrososphaerales archaeon]
MIRRQAKRNRWTSGLQRISNAQTSRKSSARGRAVSPVIAEMILVALTVTIGLAFWGSANSIAGSQLQTFVNTATSDINEMNENFVIVNLGFNYSHAADPPTTPDGVITVWFYNNGKLATNITQIQVQRVSTQEVATFEKPKFVLGGTNCISEKMNVTSFTCVVVDLADPTSGPVITIASSETYKVTTTVTRGRTATLQEAAP